VCLTGRRKFPSKGSQREGKSSKRKGRALPKRNNPKSPSGCRRGRIQLALVLRTLEPSREKRRQVGPKRGEQVPKRLGVDPLKKPESLFKKRNQDQKTSPKKRCREPSPIEFLAGGSGGEGGTFAPLNISYSKSGKGNFMKKTARS